MCTHTSSIRHTFASQRQPDWDAERQTSKDEAAQLQLDNQRLQAALLKSQIAMAASRTDECTEQAPAPGVWASRSRYVDNACREEKLGV